MQSFFSSAPLPSTGPGPARAPAPSSVPGPTIVPRPVEPKRRRTLSGILLIVLVLTVAGTAWYLNSRSTAKDKTATLVTIPTMVVGTGDLQTTVRIAGTVAAERYASIM